MDLATFTEEILNGKHFLCSDYGYGLKEVQVNSLMTNVPLNQLTCFYMRSFARFGTICTILKNVKNAHGGVLLLVKSRSKCGTLLKVTLLHGYFSRF